MGGGVCDLVPACWPGQEGLECSYVTSCWGGSSGGLTRLEFWLSFSPKVRDENTCSVWIRGVCGVCVCQQ